MRNRWAEHHNRGVRASAMEWLIMDPSRAILLSQLKAFDYHCVIAKIACFINYNHNITWLNICYIYILFQYLRNSGVEHEIAVLSAELENIQAIQANLPTSCPATGQLCLEC